VRLFVCGYLRFVDMSATDRSSCQHALTSKLLSRLAPAPQEVHVLNGAAPDLNAESARYENESVPTHDSLIIERTI